MRRGLGSSESLTKSQMVSVLYMWKKEEQFPIRAAWVKAGRLQKVGEFQKSDVILHGQKGERYQ